MGQRALVSVVVSHVAVSTYLYLPHTLFLFRPFLWVGLWPASAIFLALKLAAVIGLLFLWHSIFNFSEYGLFLVLVPFAFNGSFIADLRAGNISVFEQLLIWAGFYWYARNRIILFGVAILLAASFKLDSDSAAWHSRREPAQERAGMDGSFWTTVLCDVGNKRDCLATIILWFFGERTVAMGTSGRTG